MFADMADIDYPITTGFGFARSAMNESPIHPEKSIILNENTSDELRFIVEPEVFDPTFLTRYQLEQLRLYEGWCAFGHHEYTKNLMCVLEELTRRIYGPSATIPNRILGLFSMQSLEPLVAHRSKLTSTKLPYQFKFELKEDDDINIGCGVIARPLQFQLGNFQTMLGITEKQHSGWDDIDDETYFHRSEAYKREEVVMSTTKDYEECFIMLSTMTAIRKTLHKTDKQKKSKITQSFDIRCAVTNFEVDNDSLRSRHPDIFKSQRI